jgi:hypothetical protein
MDSVQIDTVPEHTIEFVTIRGASYCFPPLGKTRIYLGAAADEDERSNKRLRSQ